MSAPIAKVKRVEPNRTYPGHELWIIDCPLCGREHVHGDGEGHRIAHCSGDALGGYVLVRGDAA